MDITQTVAGPAGLFFDCSHLTDSGWQQEHTARQSLERWCAYCGQRSSYGFGETLTTVGILTCSDPSCIASAEAEVAQYRAELTQNSAHPLRNAPPAKPSKADAEPDLFGEAA